jgi:hypothetical protein
MRMFCFFWVAARSPLIGVSKPMNTQRKSTANEVQGLWSRRTLSGEGRSNEESLRRPPRAYAWRALVDELDRECLRSVGGTASLEQQMPAQGVLEHPEEWLRHPAEVPLLDITVLHVVLDSIGKDVIR